MDAADNALTVIAAARATAERSGAPLLLAHAVTSMWDADVPAFQTDDEEPPRIVEYGPPAICLLAAADRRDAGLIVLGTRGLGRVAGVFRGSVTRKVTRRAHCPVMIVGPAADPEAPATGGHLMCTDERVLADATALAGMLGTTLETTADGAAAIVVGSLDHDLVRHARVPVVVCPSH